MHACTATYSQDGYVSPNSIYCITTILFLLYLYCLSVSFGSLGLGLARREPKGRLKEPALHPLREPRVPACDQVLSFPVREVFVRSTSMDDRSLALKVGTADSPFSIDG